MVRVCKQSGHTLIITHGTPEKRMKDFLSYDFSNTVTIRNKKIRLSDLAQLINLLRTNLQDKPLKFAIENKEYLKSAVKECKFVPRFSNVTKKRTRVIRIRKSET